MSKEEVWFDEETDEVVVELDGSNDYLNSLLRQANEEADRRWEARNEKSDDK
jgi:hypothetical protein